MKQLKTMLMTALFGAVAIAPMPMNAMFGLGAITRRRPWIGAITRRMYQVVSGDRCDRFFKKVDGITSYWPPYFSLVATHKEEGKELKLAQYPDCSFRVNDGEGDQHIELTETGVNLNVQPREVSREWYELTGFGRFVGTAIVATGCIYLGWLWAHAAGDIGAAASVADAISTATPGELIEVLPPAILFVE